MIIHLPDPPSWAPAVGQAIATVIAIAVAWLKQSPVPRGAIRAFFTNSLSKGAYPMSLNLTKATGYLAGIIAVGLIGVELHRIETDPTTDDATKRRLEIETVQAKGTRVLVAFGVPADFAAEVTSAEIVGLAADAVHLAERAVEAFAHHVPATSPATDQQEAVAVDLNAELHAADNPLEEPVAS